MATATPAGPTRSFPTDSASVPPDTPSTAAESAPLPAIQDSSPSREDAPSVL